MKKTNGRPAWVEIDLKAVEDNYKLIKSIIGENVKITAVVKANAYGHGAVRILNKLTEIGQLEMAAVSVVDEAIELRNAGIKLPILLIADIDLTECEKVAEYDLTPMLYSLELARKLDMIGKENNKKIKVHIRIDTTHGSLGIEEQYFAEFYNEITKLKWIEVEGIFTQLYSAYGEHEEMTKAQLQEFNKVLEYLNKNNIWIKLIHAASTPAIFGYKEAHYNMVRPGGSLYGVPFNDKFNKLLKPIMSIKAKVMSIKTLKASGRIGYEGGSSAEAHTKLATIPLGYADARFLLNLKNGEVIINGKRSPILGKPCMDHFQVDISNRKDVHIGDEVVIIGEQNGEVISIEEIMNKAEIDMLNCEIICMTSKRMPKIYIENNKAESMKNYLEKDIMCIS